MKGEHKHCFPYVAEQRSWLANLDSLIKTLSSRVDKPLRIGIDFSDRVSRVEISVIAYEVTLKTRTPNKRMAKKRTLVIYTDI